MKKPDYGNATPKDLARALMSERLKAIHYQRSVSGKAGSSQPAAEQPPSSEPGCQAPSCCDDPQTPGRSDQDA